MTTQLVAIKYGDDLMIALDNCRNITQVTDFGKALHERMTETVYPNIVALVIEEARNAYRAWQEDPNGMYTAIYGEMFNEEAMYEKAQDEWASRAYGSDPEWAR